MSSNIEHSQVCNFRLTNCITHALCTNFFSIGSWNPGTFSDQRNLSASAQSGFQDVSSSFLICTSVIFSMCWRLFNSCGPVVRLQCVLGCLGLQTCPWHWPEQGPLKEQAAECGLCCGQVGPIWAKGKVQAVAHKMQSQAPKRSKTY